MDVFGGGYAQDEVDAYGEDDAGEYLWDVGVTVVIEEFLGPVDGRPDGEGEEGYGREDVDEGGGDVGFHSFRGLGV